MTQKLIDKLLPELDNLMYLVGAIILVVISALVNEMSEFTRTLINLLFGAMLIKVKGGTNEVDSKKD